MDELIEKVGIDASRFFFLQKSADTHLNFDLSLAKEQSSKNPVYYVQYAHARICSILEKAKGLQKAQATSHDQQDREFQISGDESRERYSPGPDHSLSPGSPRLKGSYPETG
jgi:arginyl-tRNA synthetase